MSVSLPEFLALPPMHHLHHLPDEMVARLCKIEGTVGVTFGTFDLLHSGHMLMMREAKLQACDFLFVGLQTDPTIDRPSKNAPVESLQERHIRIEANKYIDAYGLYHTEAELEHFLLRYSRNNGGFIDVRILDEEYREKPYTGKGIIPPYYNWRDHPYSTTELRQRTAKLSLVKSAAA